MSCTYVQSTPVVHDVDISSTLSLCQTTNQAVREEQLSTNLFLMLTTCSACSNWKQVPYVHDHFSNANAACKHLNHLCLRLHGWRNVGCNPAAFVLPNNDMVRCSLTSTQSKITHHFVKPQYVCMPPSYLKIECHCDFKPVPSISQISLVRIIHTA